MPSQLGVDLGFEIQGNPAVVAVVLFGGGKLKAGKIGVGAYFVAVKGGGVGFKGNREVHAFEVRKGNKEFGVVGQVGAWNGWVGRDL